MPETKIICTNPTCNSENVIFSKKRGGYFCEECEQEVIIKKTFKQMNIFLSYGRDQYTEFAEKIKNDLKARGHNVWFDKEKLREGGDWENYIEDGLKMVSDNPSIGRFVYIVTPHSARKPDGYCLNEIARILTKNVGIVPVMLVYCELPLSICRIQWLDAQNCVSNYTSASYDKTFQRLIEALEDDKLDYEGFQSNLFKMLTPIDFGSDIFYHLRNFTGRKWLIEILDNWLADVNGSKVFVLEGGPGVGKTAISAYLIDKKKEIVGYHLCNASDTKMNNPINLVKSIAFQLSTQIKEYQDRLAQVTLDKETDAITLFNDIVSQPLSRINKPEGNIFILIDALDEAKSLSNINEIAELISSVFHKTPDWLRMIVTTRPEPGVIELLRKYNPYLFNASSDDNINDIKIYLSENIHYSEGSVKESAIQSIVSKSEGNFLYVKEMCHDIALKIIDITHPDKFPCGMGDLFLKSFKRKFGNCDYRKEIDPILRVIIAALEPISIDYLSRLLSISETELYDFLNKAGSFFPVNEDKIKPFHKSLTDWITDRESANIYAISRNDSDKKMGELSHKLFGELLENLGDPNNNTYCINYSFIHQYKAGMKKELLSNLNHVLNSEKDTYEIFNSGINKLFFWVIENKIIEDEILFKSLLSGIQIETDISNKIRYRHFLSAIACATEKTGHSSWALHLHDIVFEIDSALILLEPKNIEYRGNLALSYNNIGTLNSALGNSQKAIEFGEKSVCEIKELILLDPEKVGLKKVFLTILVNLSKNYALAGDLKKCIECSEIAISVAEELNSIYPKDNNFISILINMYVQVINLYKSIGNEEKVEEILEKNNNLIKTYGSRLDSHEIEKKMHVLINTILNSEKTEENIIKFIASIKILFEEASQEAKALLIQNPNSTEIMLQLFILYFNVGKMLAEFNQTEAALIYYEKGISQLEVLIEIDPDRTDYRQYFIANMAIIFGCCSIDDTSTEADICKFLPVFGKIAKASESLVKKVPDRMEFRQLLLLSFSLSGDLNELIGESKMALCYYEKTFKEIDSYLTFVPETKDSNEFIYSIIDDLGKEFKELGDQPKAISLYEKSLTVVEKMLLIEQESLDYKQKKCANLIELGNLHKELGHNNEALYYFEKLSELRIALFETNPLDESLKEKLASSYSSLGDILQKLGRNEEAIPNFEKCVELREELYGSNPQDDNRKDNLLTAYSGIGDLHKKMDNNKEALRYFEKLSELRKALFEANIQDVIRKDNLAISYFRVGNLYNVMDQKVEALNYFEKCSSLFKELYESNSKDERIKGNLAIFYSSLGDVLKEVGRNEEAIANFKKCVELREELYHSNSQDNTRKNNLITSYSSLGDFHKLIGKNKEALNYFEKLSELRKALFETNPLDESRKENLAFSYSSLGALHQLLGNKMEALNYFEMRLKLYKEICESNPKDERIKGNLADYYSSLGDILMEMARNDDALNYFEKLSVLRKELDESKPQDESRKENLAFSYSSLGNLYKQMGNKIEALNYFEMCFKLYTEIYISNPKDARIKRNLAIFYSSLGDLHKEMGHNNEALNYYELLSYLRKELYDANPNDISSQSYLCISYAGLGYIYQAMEMYEDALNVFEKRFALSKEFFEGNPQEETLKQGFAVSYGNLGGLYLSLNNLNRATQNFNICKEIFTDIAKNNPSSNSIKGCLAGIEAISAILFMQEQPNDSEAFNQLNNSINIWQELNKLPNNNYEKDIDLVDQFKNEKSDYKTVIIELFYN
ncbi:MAG: toll/interleukin-1 receptor domain-containing protein [Prolixibacteraceae bacterium]|nr:toll/interleukin-1 receptor domain-containing protein [Prolixibacteraceae bacterium]